MMYTVQNDVPLSNSANYNLINMYKYLHVSGNLYTSISKDCLFHIVMYNSSSVPFLSKVRYQFVCTVESS